MMREDGDNIGCCLKTIIVFDDTIDTHNTSIDTISSVPKEWQN